MSDIQAPARRVHAPRPRSTTALTSLWVVLLVAASEGSSASTPSPTPRGGACATSFDCSTAAAPVCDGGSCVAGPASCTGDDNADLAPGDDGPAGARAFADPPVFEAAICNQPGNEADFYRATVVDSGQNLTVTLSWSGASDLDLEIFDSTGRLHGMSLHQNPETVPLSLLLAGTYYARVSRHAASAHPQAVPYTLTATLGPPGNFCKVASDCSILGCQTCLYRSRCFTGGCEFDSLSGQPLGSGCDSDANCASGHCSYVAFESDRGSSVCTKTCSLDSDCSSLPEAPVCSSGRAPNVCLPACTADLECGADPFTSSPDAGLPWDFLSCNAGSGRCTSWIFKDGVEAGDPAYWSSSTP